MKARMVRSYRVHMPDLGITRDVICPVEQEHMDRLARWDREDVERGFSPQERPYKVVWLRVYGRPAIEGWACGLYCHHEGRVPHVAFTFHN